MKKTLILFAIATAAAAVIAAPAQAQNYPWCAQYGGSTGSPTNCGFSSYRQCMADIGGGGGVCVRNNSYRPQGGPRHRLPSQ